MTFTDPIAFEKPWIVTRYYRRSGGDSRAIVRTYLNLDDRLCVPNVKIDENGFQVALLPQELEAQQAGKSATKKGKKK